MWIRRKIQTVGGREREKDKGRELKRERVFSEIKSKKLNHVITITTSLYDK